jgi:hypothetical protein
MKPYPFPLHVFLFNPIERDFLGLLVRKLAEVRRNFAFTRSS